MFKQLTAVLLNRPEIREQWEKMTDYNRANVNNNERVTSLVFGGTMFLGGLRRPVSIRGLFSLAGGSFLLYRGLRGYCPIYGALDYSSLTSSEKQQLIIERQAAQEQEWAEPFDGYDQKELDEKLYETFPASDATASY
ncbi:MAG: DUF2892 domain-containing protein [Anaerolineae bacterium]|nr:DUF2892 domain-containing protein [Anaerolineae bacterium]MCB0224713.1 DUF2892 domain-containing protein [Anaerolineae bacterium]MCB9107890.1 DUF2892 domain-containing protein [Anaerolineales bacterium]